MPACMSCLSPNCSNPRTILLYCSARRPTNYIFAVNMAIICICMRDVSQGIQRHLGKGERLDICLLIPVLRFQRQFGLDPDEEYTEPPTADSEEGRKIAEEAAKRAHVQKAIMAGMYFGTDKSGKARKLDDVLADKRKAREGLVKPTTVQSAASTSSDGLTKVRFLFVARGFCFQCNIGLYKLLALAAVTTAS